MHITAYRVRCLSVCLFVRYTDVLNKHGRIVVLSRQTCNGCVKDPLTGTLNGKGVKNIDVDKVIAEH